MATVRASLLVECGCRHIPWDVQVYYHSIQDACPAHTGFFPLKHWWPQNHSHVQLHWPGQWLWTYCSLAVPTSCWNWINIPYRSSERSQRAASQISPLGDIPESLIQGLRDPPQSSRSLSHTNQVNYWTTCTQAACKHATAFIAQEEHVGSFAAWWIRRECCVCAWEQCLIGTPILVTLTEETGTRSR